MKSQLSLGVNLLTIHFTVQFLRKFCASKLHRSLEKATANIKKHQKLFFRAIEQAEREVTATQDVINSHALGQIRAAVMTDDIASLTRQGPHRSSSKVEEGSRTRLTTITARPNPSFVGREDEIQHIHDYFTFPQARQREGPGCVVIHGLGGQGKTQTALQYYWVYRHDYDAAFWIRSETAEQLEAGYLAIARKLRTADLLGQPRPPSGDSEDAAREVENAREWLEGTGTSTD